MIAKEKEVIVTDVLVVGAGSAGCRAAMRASELGMKVVLVDKGCLGRSGASPFAHGMMAPVPPGAHRAWLEELVRQSQYLGDQEWLEVILREQGERVKELQDWGVDFEKNTDGTLKYVSARGQIVSKAINFNGIQMMDKLREVVRKRAIKVVERVMLIDLLTSDGGYSKRGQVIGAVGLSTLTGRIYIFKAKAIVLATGPFATKCHLGTYMDGLTGEGQAAAFRAGAVLTSMEFATHGAFNYIENRFRVIGQSKLQGLGARFINRLGERVMEKYDPQTLEQSTFALICQSLVKEVLEGRGPVYLDMRHFTEEQINTLGRILPETMKSLFESGIDIREKLVEVKPVANLGSTGPGAGIRTGVYGETNISGLFAAGNVSKVPQGVANWGSIPQSYAFVSGYRAGGSAAKFASMPQTLDIQSKQIEEIIHETVAPSKKKKGLKPDDIFQAINRIVNPAERFYFKNETRINKTLDELRELRRGLPSLYAVDVHELTKANEARNILLIAELVYLSALQRKESRGPHYREDYPLRDDKHWLKWITVQRTPEEIKVKAVPVPFGRYPLKPQSLGVVPHPVQFKFEDQVPSPVEISPEICNGCRICLDSCSVDVLRMNEENKAYPAYPRDCHFCTLCENDCPVRAIKVSASHRIPRELLSY